MAVGPDAPQGGEADGEPVVGGRPRPSLPVEPTLLKVRVHDGGLIHWLTDVITVVVGSLGRHYHITSKIKPIEALKT